MSTNEDDVMAGFRKKAGRASRIALSSNGGGWKPRKTESLTLPSGQVVQVRRPGPEFLLRAGRVARTFSSTAKKTKPTEADSSVEYGLSVIEGMSDEELAAVMIFARDLVCSMVVSPKIVLNPRPGFNEIGPDDIGEDLWFLFNYAMSGYFNLSVPVGHADTATEVHVADLTTFREEPSVSGDSVDSAEVRTDPEQSVGDPGLVSGP